jgi:hypothetical protein
VRDGELVRVFCLALLHLVAIEGNEICVHGVKETIPATRCNVSV